MAYDVKNVFYLDTELAMPLAATTGVGKSNTVQLDLSSYIDPIARGRSKGTGLAVYKVHWSVNSTSEGGQPGNITETGSFRAGLIAGAGFGSQSGATLTGEASFPSPNNALSVFGFDWYGAKSTVANASTPGGETFTRTFLEPSKDVPYVIVRDNVCLMATMQTGMAVVSYISVRLECAQITLDQATLNQLLRTQTV
jgi:hypothetical protein